MKAILKDKYYNVGEERKYLVQTCSQVKNRGIKLPGVHGADKGVDPDLKPEWIVRKAQKLVEKSRLEQDREDPSREMNTPIEEQTQFTGENHVREQLVPTHREGINVPQVNQNIDKCIEQNKNTKPKNAHRLQAAETWIPFYPDPVMKPLPILPDKNSQNDRQINMDL